MVIIWGHRTYKRMPWSIRLAASEFTHFTIHVRKESEALEINKPKTINEKNKTFTVLNRDNGDYVTTNSWKPLFMKMGND